MVPARSRNQSAWQRGFRVSTHSNLDRQTFQDLLANAFAVQQSQIDRQWLAAAMEIQRLNSAGNLALPEKMNLVAESARSVANAAAVAVGLLEGNQIVYRAGTGSAADDVGTSWTASLVAPVGSGEILRVENAEVENSIQAAICRQLGAKAALILPICKMATLAGVMEIRFDDPHAFEASEIRTYRLMAVLIGDALTESVPVVEKEKPPALPAVAHINRIAAQAKTWFEYDLMRGSAKALYQRRAAALAGVRQSLAGHTVSVKNQLEKVVALRTKDVAAYKKRFNLACENIASAAGSLYKSSTARLVTLWNSQHRQQKQWAEPVLRLPKRVPAPHELLSKVAHRVSIGWYKSPRKLALVAVTVAVAISGWAAFFYKDFRSDSASASISKTPAATEAAVENPAPLQAAKPPAAQGASEPSARPLREKTVNHASAASRRMRVSANEVDSVRGDVTVRYFNGKPATPRKQLAKAGVEHIGDDVTVRYFTPAAGARPAAR